MATSGIVQEPPDGSQTTFRYAVRGEMDKAMQREHGREQPLPSPTRLAVLLAIALAVAIGGSSGKSWIAPSLPVVLLGAGLAGLAVLAPIRRLPLAVLGATVALGAAAGHVLVAPGMPRVHDLMHLWGIWAYGRCVLEGSWLPLWIPYLGAGEPLLQFYGPVNFLLALPGVLAGLSPVNAFKLELFAGHVLAPLSMLAAARMLKVGWRTALIGAAALAFAPYRLTVLDYRGALGEANAFLFMPLVIGATLRMVRDASLRIGVVLAASTTALALTHLLSLFVVLVALVPTIVIAEWDRPLGQTGRRLGLTSLAFAAAAGLSAVFWVPIVAESGHTSLKLTTVDNPYYRYQENGVSVRTLFERRGWDRLRVSLPESIRRRQGLDERDAMPFYFGTVLMLSGVGAGLWSRRRDTWALAAGAFVCLALTLASVASVVGELPWLSPIRFPWRFLGPASVLAGLALALGADSLFRTLAGWKRNVVFWILLGFLTWDGLPYTGAADRIPHYRGIVHWYTDDPDWSHWATSMQPVTVSFPDGTISRRVRNLELPPSEYNTDIDSFFPAYYEWLTPTIYNRYWKSTDPARLAAAGVGYGFSNNRRDPAVWPARPYATLVSAQDIVRPANGNVSRGAGKIRVDLERFEHDVTLVVLEQHFPGWKVRVDGGAWRDPVDREGFLSVALAGGAGRVEFEYRLGTAARRTGAGVSLLTLIAGLFALRVGRAGRRLG